MIADKTEQYCYFVSVLLLKESHISLRCDLSPDHCCSTKKWSTTPWSAKLFKIYFWNFYHW